MRRLVNHVLALVLLGVIVGVLGALGIAAVVPDAETPTPAAPVEDRTTRSATKEPGSTATPGRPTERSRSPSPRGTREPAASPLTVADTRPYDPLGDGHEHDAETARAVDRSATTVWVTEHYSTPRFGGLKRGVGLLVDLGRPRAVEAVTLRLVRSEGSTVQLRAGNQLGSLADMPVVETLAGPHPKSTVRPAGSTKARYWLVWFTRVPAEGDHYRGGVAAITLKG